MVTYNAFQNRLFSLRIIHFLIYLHQKYQFSYGKTMTAQNLSFVVEPFCCTGMWVSAHHIFLNLFKIYKKAVFADRRVTLGTPIICQYLLYSPREGLYLLTGV